MTALRLAFSVLSLAVAFGCCAVAEAKEAAAARSPNGRNAIAIEVEGDDGNGVLQFTVSRDGRRVLERSPLGPVLSKGTALGEDVRVLGVQQGKLDERFEIPWGKTTDVVNACSYAVVTLETPSGVTWEIELRAYDDGVACRYRAPKQEGLDDIAIRDEATEFRIAGDPTALYNTLDGFTTSHESLYERKPLSQMPAGKLIDLPILLTWSNGQAAAITEGRVLDFAGMYLERSSDASQTLQGRLSPLPGSDGVSVRGKTPLESPWRVVLLGDQAGKLLESNLLVCLNDPPRGDFAWAKPGKTAFHWWNGEFEQLYKTSDSGEFVAKHKQYIDFCARNGIAYHGLSGDGRTWYVENNGRPGDYGRPGPDADVCTPRPELHLPEILEYAREKGVGIRLWVHWKPLSEKLEEAFTLYEEWGVKGLMVDFLDRDDQEMIEWSEKMLECAARHKLHIQIHGSSKYSGEQRTFPNLFNREGVLNLEYLKWSKLCTPDHAVNVAYTRALAGPVDYHLGGFESVSRAKFEPRDLMPVVMGTRCHNMALYVVYENPMPMVADSPSRYEGEPGFDFVKSVPVTWDETCFVAGEPGEYLVLARRKGDVWYLAGITNWTAREIDIPLGFLGNAGSFTAKLHVDGSMDEEQPNAVEVREESVEAGGTLKVKLAPGGGFVGELRAK
jgi:alpha-glucosidase